MKSIIFDFGVVLLDVDYSRTISAFGRLGLDEPAKAFSKHSQDELFRKLERGEIEEDEFIIELSNRMGGADATKVREAWCAMLGSLPVDKFNLLQKLSGEFDLYILSNTNIIHQQHFELTIDRQFGWESFRRLFQDIGYSHEMGMRKPDEEVYEEFLRRNDIMRENVLFIDDTEVNVSAARKAGIKSVHYRAEDDPETLIKSEIKF